MHPNNWFARIPVVDLAKRYFLSMAPKPGFGAYPADKFGSQRVQENK